MHRAPGALPPQAYRHRGRPGPRTRALWRPSPSSARRQEAPRYVFCFGGLLHPTTGLYERVSLPNIQSALPTWPRGRASRRVGGHRRTPWRVRRRAKASRPRKRDPSGSGTAPVSRALRCRLCYLSWVVSPWTAAPGTPVSCAGVSQDTTRLETPRPSQARPARNAGRTGGGTRSAQPPNKSLYPASRRSRALGHLVRESTDFRAPLYINIVREAGKDGTGAAPAPVRLRALPWGRPPSPMVRALCPRRAAGGREHAAVLAPRIDGERRRTSPYVGCGSTLEGVGYLHLLGHSFWERGSGKRC
jgi:hypothetical protein